MKNASECSADQSSPPSGRTGIGLHELPAFLERAAGVDVASHEHWVCCPSPDGAERDMRKCTTTSVLERLVAWLREEGIKTVAMESTHVYWLPLYELLRSRALRRAWSTSARCTTCRGARPACWIAGGCKCCTAGACRAGRSSQTRRLPACVRCTRNWAT